MDSVYENDKNGKYKNQIPFSKETRKEYDAEERRLNEVFKQDVFQELGIQNNPKRELLFEKAWDRGHANGLYEVYNEALDLVDLIR